MSIYVPGKVVLAKDYIPVDPDFNSVSLLLHGNADGSGNILDSSPSPKTVSKFGNAASATPPSYPNSNSAFGNAIAFDGTEDYILPSASNDYAFGLNDFTVELWVNFTSTSNSGILQLSTTAGGFSGQYTNGLALAISGILLYGLGGGTLINTGTSISTGSWNHIAATRQGSSFQLFLNGISIVRAINATNITATNLVIGGYYSSSYTLSGFICDLRITKGVARYTANFTPPTAPFPDIASR